MATPVPQKDDVEHWTVEQVAAWLQQMQLSGCCDTFLRKGIDGHKFLQLTEEELHQWGRDISIRSRMQIMKLVNQIKSLQHPGHAKQSIEISRYIGSQHQKSYHDNGVNHPAYVSSYSDDDDEEECAQQEASPTPPVPPRFQGHLPNMMACSSFPRTVPNNYVMHAPGSRPPETRNDDTRDDSDDFSCDEEETGEHPRQMQPVNEDVQGEESIDDLYLIPLPASPSTNHSNMQWSGHLSSPSNNSSVIHQPGMVPWKQVSVKSERGAFGSDTQNNGRSGAPVIPERMPRAPVPLHDNLTSSHKQPPPLHFQAFTSSGTNPSSLHRGNISHGQAESGNSGVKGSSPLHRPKFPSSTLPGWHTDNESSHAHLHTHSLENNEHEYEVMDIPQGPFGSNEIPGHNMPGYSQPDRQAPRRPRMPPPRNKIRDFNDQDLSSKLGPVSLSHAKRPPAPLPPHARHQTEGHVSNQARSSPTDLPNQTDQSRQPKAHPSFSGNSVHSSQKTFHQESHAPQVLSTMPREGTITSVIHQESHALQVLSSMPREGTITSVIHQESHALQVLSTTPREGTITSVNLGNGEFIELIPLYRLIMDKPYFQFVSRPKAKELVLQGGEGTFIIRPSTRTEKPLTLTVKHDDRSYNINVRMRPDGLFALGNEKASERTFSSIDEIVYTYYKEPITLENGKSALLKYSPSKPRNIYVKHIPCT